MSLPPEMRRTTFCFWLQDRPGNRRGVHDSPIRLGKTRFLGDRYQDLAETPATLRTASDARFFIEHFLSKPHVTPAIDIFAGKSSE